MIVMVFSFLYPLKAFQPRAVAGVAFNQQGEGTGSWEERDVRMLPVHGTDRAPVQIDKLFAPQAAEQDNPLPDKRFR